jgi:4-amino-4-deoxy-L-arabinose transferase-like glycosyltransferase
MSVTVGSRPAVPSTPTAGRADTAHRTLGDPVVVGALALVFAALVTLTWRKWGMPEGDAGAELTTADLIKHGAVAYLDVRYFYGPLGLYSLASAFTVFGTSFTVVYAFGLAQAAAILGVFYALARQWLAPLTAGLSTAVVVAIGFSGTSFNFVVPHTDSATFGLLTTLLMLLALRRERLLAAGVAAGLVGLTRPEFLSVAGAACVAYIVATWQIEGWRSARGVLWRLAVPAVAIPVVVLGWFAAKAGLSNLVLQNLWPVSFLSKGAHTESNWMPLALSGVFGLVARGTLYCACLAALVVGTEQWSRRSGTARVAAVIPLVMVAGSAFVVDLLLRASGAFVGERSAIEGEMHHLILGMSALPALAVGTFVWAAIRLARRGRPPLSASWAADFALIVAATGLSLRAYNAFTAEGSYAPYYAAPAVLVVAILHARLAEHRPQARPAALGALGLVALGLAGYAVFGLYRHLDVAVHTARGTFVTTADAGPVLQRVVDDVDRSTTPSARILAAPIDGGIYFFTDRRPALRELSLLPGLIASRRDQVTAVTRMRREHLAMAVLSARDNGIWGTSAFGSGYDRLLGTYLRRSQASSQIVGSLSDPSPGTYPAHGYTIIHLRR